MSHYPENFDSAAYDRRYGGPDDYFSREMAYERIKDTAKKFAPLIGEELKKQLGFLPSDFGPKAKTPFIDCLDELLAETLWSDLQEIPSEDDCD